MKLVRASGVPPVVGARFASPAGMRYRGTCRRPKGRSYTEVFA